MTRTVEILSFGFRDYPRGPGKLSACYDLRSLVNPAGRKHAHRFPHLNGTHSAVAMFVLSDPRAIAILDSALHDIRAFLVRDLPVRVGFGCFAGRHRSVALADELSRLLNREGIPSRVIHSSLRKG